jgi:transcriptional regulator with XRE-family HTH domain
VGRKPHARERPPELKYALRWLRHRLRLTQSEVAAAVKNQGGTLSLRHYQEVEGGQKHPSPDLLVQLLRALGSDEGELRGLLDTRPWAARPLGRYYPSRVLPRPEQYVAAGRRALEALPEGATWSSTVAHQQNAEAPTAAILAELGVLMPQLPADAQRRVLELARELARPA